MKKSLVLIVGLLLSIATQATHAKFVNIHFESNSFDSRVCDPTPWNNDFSNAISYLFDLQKTYGLTSHAFFVPVGGTCDYGVGKLEIWATYSGDPKSIDLLQSKTPTFNGQYISMPLTIEVFDSLEVSYQIGRPSVPKYLSGVFERTVTDPDDELNNFAIPFCKLVQVDPVAALQGSPKKADALKFINGYQIINFGYVALGVTADRSVQFKIPTMEWTCIDHQP